MSNKSLRIGVVLNRYPVLSETFIDTFLNAIQEHDVIVYARLEKSNGSKIQRTVRPYLNQPPRWIQTIDFITTCIRIFIHIRRFTKLKRKGLSTKQLIADATIWTTPSLDILHFPFANTAFGREHYAKILGAKMTISFRGSDINVYPIYHDLAYDSIWPYISKIHCNSLELQNKLSRYHTPSSIPIIIINPALRAELQDMLPRVQLNSKPGNHDDPLIITTLGRLHWIKDYPFAFRIISKLKKSGIRVIYTVLGEGQELEQLVFLKHELGLTEEVHIVGKASPDEIRRHFTRTHIYLQTSLAEGFSNACLEAQAFGLPCIVPDISGMSACIEDGKTGSIVKERTEDAFVNAIINQLDNITHFDHAYTANRAKNNFTLKQLRNQWMAFFGDI